MVQSTSLTDRAISAVNALLLIAFAVMAMIPFVHVIAGSFADRVQLYEGGIVLFPREPTLASYRRIFSTPTIPRSLVVSVGVTVVGTLANLFFTITMAYALAQRRLKSRRVILLLVTFTIMFEGGLIPTFLVVRSLGLLDTYAALILPVAISPYYMIIVRTFFLGIPEELQESARIDGATDIRILASIILPLSMPTIATFVVLYGVQHWNSWFHAIIYLNDPRKYPIQVVLRQVIAEVRIGLEAAADDLDAHELPPEGMRLATIVVAMVPIMLVYPFLQKHFVHGMMVGSIKG